MAVGQSRVGQADWGGVVMAGALAALLLLSAAPPILGLAGMALGDGAVDSAQSTPFRQNLLVLGRTLGLSAGGTCVALVLGALCAAALRRMPSWPRRAMMLCLPLPLLIPSYVLAIGWIELRSTPLAPLALPYGWNGATLVFGLRWFPIPAFALGAALSSITPSMLESARLHGLGRWGRIRRIILPQTASVLFISGLFVFLLCFADYGIPSLFRVRAYAQEVLVQQAAFLNPAGAILAGLPGTLLALAGLGLYGRRFFDKRFGVLNAQWRRAAGTHSPLAVVGWTAIPALVLFFAAGIPLFGHAMNLRGWEDWANVAECLGDLNRSLLTAFFAASLAATLALPAAYGLARPHPRPILLLWVCLPLCFTPAAFGVFFIALWNGSALLRPLFDSPLGLILAEAAVWQPVIVLFCLCAIASQDARLEDSARILGVRAWERLSAIVAPLASRAWLAGALVAFCFIFGGGQLAALCAPPDWPTLPSRLFSFLHTGRQERVAAICLVLAAAPMALGALAAMVGWRMRGRQ